MSAPRPPHATSSSSSSLEDSPFQRANPYNVHLPYAVEAEADRFLAEIKRRLKAAVQSDAITDQAIPAVVNLHKYIILYGLRFTLQDHVLLIKICFQVFMNETLLCGYEDEMINFGIKINFDQCNL